MKKTLIVVLFTMVLLSINGYAYDCINVTDDGDPVNYWNYTGGAWNVSEGTNLSCVAKNFNLTAGAWLTVYGNLTFSDSTVIFNVTYLGETKLLTYPGSNLTIINETNLSNNREELIRLTKEANEITRIMTKAKNSLYINNK